MPAAHRWAAAPACSKFLFPAAPGSKKTCSRSAYLSVKSSLESAGCIQSGWKDRSVRTAYRNANRICTSDIAPASRSNSPGSLHTRRIAKPSAFPAYSADVGQRYCRAEPPALASPSSFAARSPNPGTRAAGICDRTKIPPETPHSAPLPCLSQDLLFHSHGNPRSPRNIYPARRAMNCLSHIPVLPSEQDRNR